SRRRHTRFSRDWSSDVCSSDLGYGWFGPRPPAGHGLHHYYFQLFALDAPLDMGPQTPLAELLNALKGHTIAQGELVATYEAPTRSEERRVGKERRLGEPAPQQS